MPVVNADMTLKSVAYHFSFETCRDSILSRIHDLIHIDRFYERFIQDYYDNWHTRFLCILMILRFNNKFREIYFCLFISSNTTHVCLCKLYEHQSRLCNHLINWSVAVGFHNWTEKKMILIIVTSDFIYKSTDARFRRNRETNLISENAILQSSVWRVYLEIVCVVKTCVSHYI